MTNSIDTGSKLVDEIGKLSITGNVIPMAWYKHITYDNGKPNLLAITILGDILYWYKPVEVRSEETGEIIGYRKKFKADLLQKSYKAIADTYGMSKRQVTAAFDLLESLNLVKREFRTIHIGDKVANNVMFVAINPEGIYQITYDDTPITIDCDRVSQSNVIPSNNQTLDPPTIKCDTNTEITTETTNNVSSQSVIQQFKEQIDYSILTDGLTHTDKRVIDAFVDVACDMILRHGPDQLNDINMFDMMFLLDNFSLAKNITSPRRYMGQMLINAHRDNFIKTQSQVNSDTTSELELSLLGRQVLDG